MKDAIRDFISAYDIYVGSSKIILLFICAVFAIYTLNIYDEESKRRRINPAVFLLSVWSGISYILTVLTKKKPWWRIVVIVLLGIIAISLSGSFIISKIAFHESIYYLTNSTITIASIAAIISFFVIYYLIASELFEDYISRFIFLGWTVVLHLFAFYTEASISFSVFLYPLSIGSIILHDLMPFALWVYLYRDRTVPKQDMTISENDDDYQEEWDLKKHKILNMRNMSIAFVVLLVAFVASVFVLNSKINNLYRTTVALQKATEDKISLYEFIPHGADEPVATLMVYGEGTAVLTGGGGEDTAQELYDFITAHTSKIDTWYLNGKEDSDIGGYVYCANKGLVVDNSYYLTGVEKIVGDN